MSWLLNSYQMAADGENLRIYYESQIPIDMIVKKSIILLWKIQILKFNESNNSTRAFYILKPSVDI